MENERMTRVKLSGLIESGDPSACPALTQIKGRGRVIKEK